MYWVVLQLIRTINNLKYFIVTILITVFMLITLPLKAVRANRGSITMFSISIQSIKMRPV